VRAWTRLIGGGAGGAQRFYGAAGAGASARPRCGYAAGTGRIVRVARAEGRSEDGAAVSGSCTAVRPVLSVWAGLHGPAARCARRGFGLLPAGVRVVPGRLAVLGMLSEVTGPADAVPGRYAQWLTRPRRRRWSSLPPDWTPNRSPDVRHRDPAAGGDCAHARAGAAGCRRRSPALLASVMPGADERVRDRIIAEYGGNPWPCSNCP